MTPTKQSDPATWTQGRLLKEVYTLKGNNDKLINALKQVQDYLQINEHFLPETQDREEIASVVLEALKESEG